MKNPNRSVIVGGVAGGASAAAKARRVDETADIQMFVRDPSHAYYYPGAKPVLIKIVAEEGTGRLLGAQVLGERGIDKRVMSWLPLSPGK